MSTTEKVCSGYSGRAWFNPGRATGGPHGFLQYLHASAWTVIAEATTPYFQIITTY
jgi:hypothetical protein